MNFEDIKKLEKNTALKISVTKTKGSKVESESDQDLVKDLIKTEANKDYLEKPFEYFYEDVISEILKFEFESALGSDVYSDASDDALVCLETCRNFSNMNQYKIHGWLVCAFKFIDHFVLHYIQDVKKETVTKKPIKSNHSNKSNSIKIFGDEMSRYIHLQKYGGEINKAALNLILLYKLRNKKLEHRTRTIQGGRQALMKPDFKAAFKEVRYKYPEVLKIFLSEYKLSYPKFVLK